MAKKDQGDGFWPRFIITLVAVIWVALVGGNWLGHFVVTKVSKSPGTAAAEEMNIPTPRPKPWRTAEPSLQRELDEQRQGLVGEGQRKAAPVVTATPVPEASPSASSEKKEEPKETAAASPEAKPEEKAAEKPAEKPEPKPAKTPDAPPAPQATPEKAPTPEPQAASTEPPAPTPAAEGGDYQLQFGSFSSEENAQALVQRLSGEGQDARVEAVQTDQGTVYRVSGGSYSDEAAARSQADRLRGSGIDAFVRR